jgi:NitT/TauT family transport system substrate-binding protein
MDDLGYAVTGIMFHAPVLEQKGPALKAFYKAYDEAVSYIHTHTVEDLRTVLVEEIGFPPELLSNVCLPHYTPAQAPREADLEAVAAWLQSKNLIPNPFSTERLPDARFIQP